MTIKEFSCGCVVEVEEDGHPAKFFRECLVLESRMACVEPYPEQYMDTSEYDCMIEHLYGKYRIEGTTFIPVPSEDQLPEVKE